MRAKEPALTVKIIPNDGGSPPTKVADAEVHFLNGPLSGLKLIGFAVWECRGKRTVTFPARLYFVNGERRGYALLRPVDHKTTACDRIRDLILAACPEAQGTIA